MSRHTLLSALTLLASVCAVPALAQEIVEPAPAAPAATPAPAPASQAEATVEDRRIPRLDLGLGGGINNPAGIYGVEASYRLLDYVSAGVAAGNGAWGFRISPLVRAYPFGASRVGLFAEGGVSLNLGSAIETKVNGQLVQRVDQLFTPVVDMAVGYRFQISRYGWLALRAGYGLKLGGNDNYRVSQGPTQLDLITQGVVDLAQPGGIMAGIAGGVTFL